MLYVDTYPKFGGGQQSLFRLVTRLSPGRYRALVALPRSSPLPPLLKTAGVASVLVPFSGSNNTLPSLHRPLSVARAVVSVARVVWVIGRLARREKVDLIHANSVVAGVHALPVAMMLRLPCVVHARDFNTAPLTNRALRLMLRYRRSAVLFVSHALERFYHETSDSKHYTRRHLVIHNGVDPREFRPDAQARDLLLKELGIDSECFVVGAVGRIERWKGFDLLVEAFALVVKEHQEARLVLVGDVVFNRLKNVKTELLEKVRTLGLQDKVIFTGFRDDMSTIMAGIDLLAHSPVEPEAFGLILIEAMACGRPIVSVPLGGIPEVVHDGENGLLAQVGDPASIAGNICRIINDPVLARRMGEAGRRMVEERFNIAHRVHDIEQLYDRMLGIMNHEL